MYRKQTVLQEEILYYSTNLRAPAVSFREALLKGLAPDGGLYMPSHLPQFTNGELEALSEKNYAALASQILNKLIGRNIDIGILSEICNDIYKFSIPIDYVNERNYVMRLDQGPTASFKDFAALLMGRLMQHYLNLDNKQITILTATSGDTGSAVANSFYGLKNIRVIILFPAGEVTELQRKQMTTLAGNIQVIEVDGKFDDCQRLVKTVFVDSSLSGLNLSTANSINIGRLLPQSVYYFWAWAQISGKTRDLAVFSVPSGNFGNLAGGLIAKRMGLPVKRFIISTNENNEVPLFFETGEYKPISPSRNCISSAMNVGHPSNLARVIAMYGGKMNEKGEIYEDPDSEVMKSELYAISVSDDETRSTMKSLYRQSGRVLEPHGAVAWMGLQKYLKAHTDFGEVNQFCICLETAHPGKFREEIRNTLNIEIELPDSLRKIETGNEEYISLENNYEILKKFIIQSY
jgi:threonine synthase